MRADKLSSKMKVKINRIYVSPVRIRQKIDKMVHLKESLTKLGQLHPLIVEPSTREDYDYELIAGFRRYTAMTDLEWEDCEVIVKEGLTNLEKIDIELEENLRRKNLFSYEITIGFRKRERIYKELHPEITIEKKHELQVRDKKGKFSPSSTRGATTGIISKDEIKEEKTPRFSKITADQFELSERTVQKHLQIGRAIEEEKYEPEIVEAYKKRELSQRQMLKLDRERREAERRKEKIKKELVEKRKLGRKAALKAIEEESTKESELADMIAAVNGVRKELEIEPLKLCGDCSHVLKSNCPNCGDEIFICGESNLFKMIESGSEACDKFNKT